MRYLKSATESDIEKISSLILLIDGYRVNRLSDTGAIEKLVNSCKTVRVKNLWANIKPLLQMMEEVPANVSNIVRLYKIRVITQFVGSAYVAIGLLIIIARQFIQFSLGIMGSVFFISALCLLPATFILIRVIDRKIALEVDQYFIRNSKIYASHYKRLKDAVQLLIDILRSRIRSSNTEPSRFLFELYNADYEKIKVVRKTGKLRKTYIVSFHD